MTTYTPPAVWDFNAINMGGKFGGTNRPTAGARHEYILPKGDKPYQLYSLNTPNGVKVNIILEELKALGLLDFDAYKIDIVAGDQFGTDFVSINPNSKIPALIDRSGDEPVNIFESGAILLHLAQKYNKFLPTDTAKHAEVLSWLMWQMGSAPFVGGGFGHFYAYAPEPVEYAINRYTMETKRQLDVLNQHLASREYVASDEYTVADMAIYPWYGWLILGKLYIGEHYNAARFLNVDEYPHVQKWANNIANKETVKKAESLVLQPLTK
ncbi:glutathione-dependent disulfide-bond oxidoreductase [Moraxella sp. ZY200743]|uniref:glutathione-dependent disulfide-bond oxidoreductase n=1 Tax=Moraxella sp. ZY200743 TaxID=2911970 RepID=UPI003D7DD708